MVEFGNSWEFDDDLINILDFPMGSLEVDELVGDWDISNLQCLGPIPSIDMWPQSLLQGLVAPIDEATGQQHQLSNHVDTSSSHIHHRNKLGNVQDSAAFKTQSPVSVLESSSSCLGGKGLSTKFHNAIPVRSRSKRGRPVGVNPWLLASPEFSTSQKAQRSNESQKKSFQHPSAMDFMKDSPGKVENLKSASSHRFVVTKKCHHCNSTKTPQWRDGPLGPRTLCNACGVRYKSGRLFPEYRPVKSPSFSPSKHSNSHKKVIEMRNKQPAGIIKPFIQITKAPEQKQPSNRVGASTSHICQQNKFSSIQESGAFETQSPVAVLESRSKCVRSACVNPPLLASKTLNSTSKETQQMSILESGSSILAVKGLSIEHDSTIPVQSRKRVRSKRFYESDLSTSKEIQQMSILESGSSILAGKGLSIEHDSTIPVQSRKRVRSKRFYESGLSTSQNTLNARRSKEVKKKPFQHPSPPIKVENLPAISDPGNGKNASANRPCVNRKCAHCETTTTPQWREREGPTGLLCNACGVRFRRGRLFPEYRPADSPTFVPSKHSNSHKRVVEMRNRAKQLEGKIQVTPISTQQEAKTEEPLLSPQPEFVPMSIYAVSCS